MQNLPNNVSKIAKDAASKVVDLTETSRETVQKRVFQTAFEQTTEIADAQKIENQNNFIEPLLGESDPTSTPFGIKHFWYKT